MSRYLVSKQAVGMGLGRRSTNALVAGASPVLLDAFNFAFFTGLEPVAGRHRTTYPI